MSQPETPVNRTADGVVTISYPSLKDSPMSLRASIGIAFTCGVYVFAESPSSEEAFGANPKALGIIVVQGLPPEYVFKRAKLLKLAERFANLPEAARERYVDPKSRYRYFRSFDKVD